MDMQGKVESGFYAEADCQLAGFKQLTAQKVDGSDVPNAIDAPSNIPVYDMQRHGADLSNPDQQAF